MSRYDTAITNHPYSNILIHSDVVMTGEPMNDPLKIPGWVLQAARFIVLDGFRVPGMHCGQCQLPWCIMDMHVCFVVFNMFYYRWYLGWLLTIFGQEIAHNHQPHIISYYVTVNTAHNILVYNIPLYILYNTGMGILPHTYHIYIHVILCHNTCPSIFGWHMYLQNDRYMSCCNGTFVQPATVRRAPGPHATRKGKISLWDAAPWCWPPDDGPSVVNYVLGRCF